MARTVWSLCGTQCVPRGCLHSSLTSFSSGDYPQNRPPIPHHSPSPTPEAPVFRNGARSDMRGCENSDEMRTAKMEDKEAEVDFLTDLLMKSMKADSYGGFQCVCVSVAALVLVTVLMCVLVCM